MTVGELESRLRSLNPDCEIVLLDDEGRVRDFDEGSFDFVHRDEHGITSEPSPEALGAVAHAWFCHLTPEDIEYETI